MISPARTPIATIGSDPREGSLGTSPLNERRLVVGLGAVGGALAVAGTLLPWLSLYAGLQKISGTDGLNGRILAGLGAVALVAALAHAVRGGQGTRWMLGIAGFALLALGSWLGIQLLQTEAVLAADPLLVARLEPGLVVSLIGGSLVFATLFVPVRSRSDLVQPQQGTARSAAQMALAAALAVAGVVHIALVSEHLRESIVLGVGFLGTGLGQVGLAALVLRTPSRTSLRSALSLSVFSLAALGAAVTVGLPAFLHGSATGMLGPIENLTDLAAITGLAELIAVALAVRLLRGKRRVSAGSSLPELGPT